MAYIVPTDVYNKLSKRQDIPYVFANDMNKNEAHTGSILKS